MGVVRKTKSVEAILSVFEQNDSAISAVDLVGRLNEQMNKTTIYRILDRLEQDGVVHSFLGRDGIKWYAKCASCDASHHHDLHPHFQCQKCGKTECLSVEIDIPVLPNRKVELSQVLLIGECEACSSSVN